MDSIFEIYAIVLTLALTLSLQYLKVADLFFSKEKSSSKEKGIGSVFSLFTNLYDKDNLNTIFFWGINVVMSSTFIMLFYVLTITYTFYLPLFLSFSWSVFLIFLLIYKRKNTQLKKIEITTALFVLFGLLFQLSILFYPENNILKSFDNYLGLEGKGIRIFIGVYYFLTINLLLSFMGGFIIRAQEENSNRYKKTGYINYKGMDKMLGVLTISISTIISLFLLDMDFKYIAGFVVVIMGGLTYSLRELIANFIAGLILLWDDSIKQNNVISIQNYLSDYDEEPYGWIDEINMRFTVVKDRNNINLIIPNSVLISNPIINWTQYDNSVRIRLDVDISYYSDLERAIRVIPLACREEDRVLKDSRYQAKVNVMRFADSAIGLQLRFYIKDPKNGIRNIKSKIFRNIVSILKEHDIEIPFPQRDVHIDFRDIDSNKTKGFWDKFKVNVIKDNK